MKKSRTVLKRQRQTIVRRERNKSARSSLKTQEKRVRIAGEGLSVFQSEIDKAVGQGVIHRNKSARKKSRLAKALKAS